MKPIVNIFRMQRSDMGTQGVLIIDSFFCYTLELPWRENKRSISCIPSGEYETVIKKSPKFGLVYHIIDVPERSNVLIHSGNFAGDTSKGYRSNVEGCILVGKNFGSMMGQWAVINSRITIRRFMDNMNMESFILQVHEKF